MRTAGRRTRRRRNLLLGLGTLFFVCLFVQAFIKSAGIQAAGLPTAGILGSGDREKAKVRASDAQDGYSVFYQNDISSQSIPIEEFLTGAVAASIDIEYEPETLKAQAVLLRGNLLRKLRETKGEAQEGSGSSLAFEELDMDYYTLEELHTIWGESFEAYYQKAKQAVQQTKGTYAKSGSQILNGNFHAMSGGKTRSGREALGDESYDYLQSVPCDKNIESDRFLQSKRFEKEEGDDFQILKRDSAGYVTKVSWNGRQLGGEQVREALGLASANFEITQGDDYLITTKGSGHGFGFDQYYANYLARENGADYMALISYFFKDISFTTDAYAQ